MSEQSFEDMSRSVYLDFASSQHQHVTDNPVCAICGKNPPVRIARWGKIAAACRECLVEEVRRFEAYCQEQAEFDKET